MLPNKFANKQETNSIYLWGLDFGARLCRELKSLLLFWFVFDFYLFVYSLDFEYSKVIYLIGLMLLFIMIDFSKLRYFGMDSFSLPHYRARAKYLFDVFRDSHRFDRIELLGRLYYDRSKGPYLSWEFELFDKVLLDFGADEYFMKFVNKSVKVVGIRESKMFFGKSYVSYVKVESIVEQDFDWTEKLPEPTLKSSNDYLSYLTGTKSEESILAFAMGLTGSNNSFNSGLGVFTHIPSSLSPIVFKPLIKSYNKLDPFQLSEGQYPDRLSFADFAKPKYASAISREDNYSEIDYLIGARPATSDLAVRKLLTGHAELFTTVGEEGLEEINFKKEQINDIKYSIFAANKKYNPLLSPELEEEIKSVARHIEGMINKETSIYEGASELISTPDKVKKAVISYAKLNNVSKVSKKEITAVEKIIKTGLIGTILDKEISETLYDESLKLRQSAVPETGSKKITGVHERITIELTKNPCTEEELYERLKAEDFSKKIIDQVLKELTDKGYVYRKNDGKYYFINPFK